MAISINGIYRKCHYYVICYQTWKYFVLLNTENDSENLTSKDEFCWKLLLF